MLRFSLTRAAAMMLVTPMLLGWPFGFSYSKFMQSKLKAALGDAVDDYRPFSYPTDNYGVGTAYTSDGSRVTLDDRDFLCDTWNCFGVSPLPTAPAKLLSLNDFAAVGAGGAVTLTDAEKREFSLKVLLPELYALFNIGAEISQTRVTTTTLQFGTAYFRKLRRMNFATFIGGLGDANMLKQAYNQGRLSIVVADVVVSDLRLTIKVDQQSQASLDAAFTPGTALKEVGNLKLGAKLSKGVQGTYTFEVTRPLVVMRLAKRQPSAGVLGSAVDDEWSDWDTLDLTGDIPKAGSRHH